MNIFPLDENFEISASYHVDSHIVKIPLECAQMMSTACRVNGIDCGYKASYINHPTSRWVRECIENWNWMKSYAEALNNEWRIRFNHPIARNHKAYDTILSLPTPPLRENGAITPIPLCMPEFCHVDGDPFSSYRKYYIFCKQHLAKWNPPRSMPKWFKDKIFMV
jgi:hypothetical protein